MSEKRTPRTLKTTETTLTIIETLESLDCARVSELAEELGMVASTVHAHLATLEAHEYVAREGDSYHLGLEFLSLGNYVGHRKRAYETAESYTRRLADETESRAVFMIEERGYAFNHEEQLEGVKAVGVPVTDGNDRVIGSFSVASPANRLGEAEFEEEPPAVILGIANEFELEHTLT